LIDALSVDRSLVLPLGRQVEVTVSDKLALVCACSIRRAGGPRQARAFWRSCAGISGGWLDSVTALDPARGQLLRYAVPEFDVEIAFLPTDFVQVNAAINRAMIGRALALLELEPGHRVLDLFCGLGNFSLPIARRAAAVVGIERRQQVRRRVRTRRPTVWQCGFVRRDTSGVGVGAWAEAVSTRCCSIRALGLGGAISRALRIAAPACLSRTHRDAGSAAAC
jgi:hypothetical protein